MNNRIDVKNIPSEVKVHKPDNHGAPQYNIRSRIYVRAVKGLHQLIRRRMGIFFLGLFALLPWLQWNDRQAILLDIGQQEFFVFGMTFWPQDLPLLAIVSIIAAFILFFVTAIYGRVWCGYMCPQTVWTFMFIWIEEKIEGSANKRKKLDSMPMSFNKAWRKTAKHTSWWIISLLTSLTFIGYFVPIDQLFIDFFTFEASVAVVSWTLFFAAATYGNAGWMREIMCLHICPYARFQSSMFDKDTFTVTYDANRGEKRGPRPRKADPKELGLGDCIDCNLCVQVCPTGIDIRNGLQYECINCGACIDACDETMDKMNYPKGLISYTTEHKIEGKQTHTWRPKMIGYLVVTVLMCAAFAWQLTSRVPLELSIERDRTVLYRTTNEGLIENTFTLQIVNKSQEQQTYTVDIEGLEDFVYSGDKEVIVAPGEVFKLPVSVSVDPYDLKKPVTTITITVTNENGEHTAVQESRFFKGM